MDLQIVIEKLKKERESAFNNAMLGTERLYGIANGLSIAISVLEKALSAEQADIAGNQVDEEGLKKVDGEAADGSKD